MSTYTYTLTPLSPIHIGTGEEITPLEYVVAEHPQHQAPWLFAINLTVLLQGLSDQQRAAFNKAVDTGGTMYLRKFIREVADLSDGSPHVRWHTQADDQLYKRYKEGLKDDSAQLQVNLMTRDERTGQPYVPGSSVKGSIRTALANAAAEAYTGRENFSRLDFRDVEPELFGYRNSRGRGEIRADPLRAVKLADAPLTPGDTIGSNMIDRIELVRTRDSDYDKPAGNSILMFYDITWSALDGDDFAPKATGKLIIDERLASTPGPQQDRRWDFQHCVSQGITADDIIAACNCFYGQRLQDEYAVHYSNRGNLDANGKNLLAQVEKFQPNQALVRLGRFSHFECVTINRYAKPPRRGCGSGRSLAAGSTMPIGWCRLTINPLA